MLSNKYQQEQHDLEQQIITLRTKLDKAEEELLGAEKWVQLIKEHSVPKKLTATLLNTLIEKIAIHAPEENEQGERTQKVDIYYRFIGKIDR